MKIESLRISGFKGIRHVSLDALPDVVVLAGPNGAGKSTILEAISLLKEMVRSYSNTRYGSLGLVNDSASEARIEARFLINQAEIEWLERSCNCENVQKSMTASLTLIKGGPESEPVCSNELKALFGKYSPSEGIGCFEHIRHHRRLVDRDASSFTVDLRSKRSSDGTNLTQGRSDFMELLQGLAAKSFGDWATFIKSRSEVDSLQGVKDLFSRLFYPKRLLGLVPSQDRLRFQVQGSTGCHDLHLMSAGEQDAFMSLVFLNELRPKGSVILYDTPEANLNGEMERRLFQELLRVSREGGNQMILATHSYEILDAAPLTSVFRISPPSGTDEGNQVECLEESSDRVRLLEALGASVGLQLVSRVVLFVEGVERSDKGLLSGMLPEMPSDVTVLPSHSVNHVMEVSARAKELLEVGARHATILALRDRDFLEDDVRGSLMQKHESLIILDRYHIENYLLASSVIEDASRRLGNAIGGIEEKILEQAEELKPLVAAKWVAFDLSQMLRASRIGSEPDSPKDTLWASVAAARGRIGDSLGEESLKVLYDKRCLDVDSAIRNRTWKRLFPGRLVLQRLNERYFRFEKRAFMSVLATSFGSLQTEERRELSALILPRLRRP